MGPRNLLLASVATASVIFLCMFPHTNSQRAFPPEAANGPAAAARPEVGGPELSPGPPPRIVNVDDYGAAAGDDATEAFLRAWEEACSSSDYPSVFLLPEGKTYRLMPLSLTGPCRATTITAMRIPQAFHQYLKNQPTGVVSLKSQSGNTWLAELVSDTEGLFFGNGWKEFAVDHSLEFGNFLTFRYDGRSQFLVVVFDGMCIEKPSSFHAKPCKDLFIDMEIDATEPSEIPFAPSEESDKTTRKRVKEMDLNDCTLKKCYRVLENGRESVGSFKAKTTRLNMDNNRVDTSKAVPLEEINANIMKSFGEMGMNDSTLKNSSTALQKGKKVAEASVDTYKAAATTSLDMDMNAAGPSEVMVVSIEKRVREMDTDGSTLEKFSNVSEKSKQQSLGASVGTYKLASTSLNCTKDSDSSSSMQEESISYNKSAESMPLLQRLYKDVPKPGKSILKIQRQPAVISQRPPITEEQKNYALQKAKRFKSKNPFVIQIMKGSNVYVGFFMKLPCEFVREILPRTSKNIKLWDPQGKAWEVYYMYYKEQSSGALSGGWSRFSLGNYLEKFDVCVFELFSKDNIKVHIYRVVPEITPFLPGSSSK